MPNSALPDYIRRIGENEFDLPHECAGLSVARPELYNTLMDRVIQFDLDFRESRKSSIALLGKRTLHAKNFRLPDGRIVTTGKEECIPSRKSIKGTFYFNHNFDKKAYVRITSSKTGRTLRILFDIKTGILPGVSVENTNFVLSRDFAEIVLSSQNLSLSFGPPLTELSDRTIQEWIEILSFWNIVNDVDVDLSVETDAGSTLIAGKAIFNKEGDKDSSADNIIILENLLKIAKATKCETKKFSIHSIFANEQVIDLVCRRFFNKTIVSNINFETEHVDIVDQHVDFLYFDLHEICSEYYVYALKLCMYAERRKDSILFTSKNVIPLQIRLLVDKFKDFDDFVRVVERISGVQNKVFDPSTASAS